MSRCTQRAAMKVARAELRFALTRPIQHISFQEIHMSDQSNLGALLLAAKKQQEVTEVLRPIAKVGTPMEKLLETSIASFDSIVIQLLTQYLNEMSVKLDPKKGSWEKEHAILCISYGSFSFRIPTKFIVGEIKTKVERKMKSFTGHRVLSVDNDGSKIWAPPEKNMIPYVDFGYQGGSYWANEYATKRGYPADGETELIKLGFAEVSEYLGIKLQEIMKRPYDGIESGTFYWLLSQPEEINPVGHLKSQLEDLDKQYLEWTNERSIRQAAGMMLHNPLSRKAIGEWWTRITVSMPGGMEKKSYGFNEMKAAPNPDILFKDGRTFGTYSGYRAIPPGSADEIRDTDYRFLNLFDGGGEELKGFYSVCAEFMGSESGLDVIDSIFVSRPMVIEQIRSYDYVKNNRIAAEKVRSYLASLNMEKSHA